jgi:N-acetyl-gamma-glutamyl-phosphate reductase
VGNPLSGVYRGFLGQDLPICETMDLDAVIAKSDFIFQAQGNGVGMKIADSLLAAGKRMIDVPADFRLKDIDTYRQFYKSEHSAVSALAEAVYGISELHPSEISSARLVANPGCYATSAILSLAPLVCNNLADFSTIIVDAKSGVSGAGRSKAEVSGLFCEVNEGFKAYAVATHRHTPEIEQELSVLAGRDVMIQFTPHLVPMNRGILATVYASAPAGSSIGSTDSLHELYSSFYSGKPFVSVLPPGEQPCTKNVFGTNYCHIGVVADERTNRSIVTCAIDNMGKGAAGQAIQNMNLMLGLPETTGLLATPVYP